ncbi:hypothetical protein VoSk93_40790 [Vibrio owensii]
MVTPKKARVAITAVRLTAHSPIYNKMLHANWLYTQICTCPTFIGSGESMASELQVLFNGFGVYCFAVTSTDFV